MSLDTLDNLVKSGAKLTPMMSQYYEIKKENKDKIVLFRMGDFYEVFFEDAKELAKILNIAQTHRGKIADTPVPMAGIPHHAAANYVDRLTSVGKRVAICEQIQDPKDAVGIVKRAVTQVVSPGIPYDLNQADQAQNFYLASCYMDNNLFSLCFIDFSSGKFFGFDQQTVDDAINLLEKYRPKEIVLYPGQFARLRTLEQKIDQLEILRNILSEDYFLPSNSDYELSRFVPNYRQDKIIGPRISLQKALCGLTNYFGNTQGQVDLNHIEQFKLVPTDKFMKASGQTLTGLEVLPRDYQTRQSSLLGYCDKTKTAMGKRHLKKLFMHPHKDIKTIENRQNVIESLILSAEKSRDLRDQLSEIRDIERVLTKITLGKGTSHDLLSFSNSFDAYKNIKPILDSLNLRKELASKMNAEADKKLSCLSKIFQDTFNDDPGASLEKRNLIKKGFHTQRDRLWELSENSEQSFNQLETKYLEQTDIPKLKIKRNNIHGHFIEVSKTHSNKIPSYFVRRQTLVNSERYTTDELSSLDKDALVAKERLQSVEREILTKNFESFKNESKLVITFCRFIEEVDVLQSLAHIAYLENWSKPKMTSRGQNFKMIGAWHPLIKKSIGETFVTHDLELNKDCYFGLITGPNMAGKTTVMREVAIIQILAQIGSFVPAKEVETSICDYVFSRLGASDNIQQGQSTFMVEMSETAEITRHATKNSLVILDEIGRGTSTYDGLSIAWSLVNFFNNKIKCRTLFATHYHELIEVIDRLKTAKNLTVRTKKEGENIHFLYELIEQGANQSFGIYVAKLAGLPTSVLVEAQNILHKLETGKKEEPNNQLSFFDGPAKEEVKAEPLINNNEVEALNYLKELNINALTPIDSLLKIKELQERLN